MTANDTVQTSQPMEDWRSPGLGRSLSSILHAAAGLPPRAPPLFRTPQPACRPALHCRSALLARPREAATDGLLLLCWIRVAVAPARRLRRRRRGASWRPERRSRRGDRRGRACWRPEPPHAATARALPPTPARAAARPLLLALAPCTVDARRAAARVWIPSSVFRRGRGEERGPTTDV